MKSEAHKLFASRLRKWRGKRYQKNAAQVLGVELQTYRNWEYGLSKPSSVPNTYAIEKAMKDNPDT